MHAFPSSPLRQAAAVLAATAAAGAATVVALPAGVAHAQTDCVVVEQEPTTWSTGPEEGVFVLVVTITNSCVDPVDGWTLDLTLAPDHHVSQGWNSTWSQDDTLLRASNLAWNGLLAQDEPVTLGFMGTWDGTFIGPLSCSLNGVPCAGAPEPDQPPAADAHDPDGGGGHGGLE